MFRRLRYMWEHRNAPYTDAITTQILANAQGTGTEPNPKNTGAASLAAAVVARAFASADVKGIEIDSSLLADIGFDLVIRGESLIVKYKGNLVRPSHWDVQGRSPVQDDWMYKVQLPGPDESIKTNYSGRMVAHPRWNADPVRPWVGVPPMDRMPNMGKLLAQLEEATANEATCPTGYLVTIPTDGQDDTINDLKEDIGTLKGNVALMETTQGGWGRGPYGSPAADWKPQRIGPAPPVSIAELLRLSQMTVLAHLGIPIELITSSDGTGQREAWRRCLHSTLQPLSKIVGDQLSRLSMGNLSVTFDFHKLFASDITGRSRAFNSMVQGGMDIAQAAAQSGLLQADD